VGELDVVKQTEQVIANIKAVVEAAGSTECVKTTVFLADMNDLLL